MAAAANRQPAEVVDLNRISVDELEPVLLEERLAWHSTLNWSFDASADLVRRFVRIRALNGHALVADGAVAGYAYYVCEERKGLVGDLYILRDYATAEAEDLLLSACLQSMVSTPGIERIEAQLMMMRGPFERAMPMSKHAQIFPRVFMMAELDEVNTLPRAATSFHFTEWDESRQDEAAILIASAYHNHIDASINDQYRSYHGARRFLTNVINYPGCGSFLSLASMLASKPNGELAGLILSSVVAKNAGHITQVCVSPSVQGQGVGYELVRRALGALSEGGCEKASLTVTAANTHAIGLYQRLGFRALRRFAAYVWEGF